MSEELMEIVKYIILIYLIFSLALKKSLLYWKHLNASKVEVGSQCANAWYIKNHEAFLWLLYHTTHITIKKLKYLFWIFLKMENFSFKDLVHKFDATKLWKLLFNINLLDTSKFSIKFTLHYLFIQSVNHF